MLYIVILPITSVIIIPFFSFTSLENVLLVTFAANCAYLLPFAILNTWINYFLLKQKQIKVWQLENPSVQKEAAGALSNSLRIKFKFTYYQRRKEIIGRAVTSPHTKLGKLFIQIVNKHIEKASQSNKPVMDNNNSFGWLFYVKSFYGLHRRYLDPDVSIVDNNISTTAIIFVKQVKKQN